MSGTSGCLLSLWSSGLCPSTSSTVCSGGRGWRRFVFSRFLCQLLENLPYCLRIVLDGAGPWVQVSMVSLARWSRVSVALLRAHSGQLSLWVLLSLTSIVSADSFIWSLSWVWWDYPLTSIVQSCLTLVVSDAVYVASVISSCIVLYCFILRRLPSVQCSQFISPTVTFHCVIFL